MNTRQHTDNDFFMTVYPKQNKSRVSDSCSKAIVKIHTVPTTLTWPHSQTHSVSITLQMTSVTGHEQLKCVCTSVDEQHIILIDWTMNHVRIWLAGQQMLVEPLTPILKGLTGRQDFFSHCTALSQTNYHLAVFSTLRLGNFSI